VHPAVADLLQDLPLRHLPLFERAQPIATLAAVTHADFEREHLAGEGRPAVLTDAMDDWPALTRWTFDFFRECFPDDEIVANSPMFLESDLGLEPVQARLRLADYIDYVQAPARAPRARYVCGSAEALARNRVPLYAPAYRVLVEHPDLAGDVAGSSLYCVDDLFARLPAPLRDYLDRHDSPVHYLFFAPRGSAAFLHTDYWSTHAYLAQLAGRKLCILFPPSDATALYDGAVRNPLAVDPARFPLFAHSRPHVAILHAGMTAFIPAGWWHFVLGLDTSLTYSYNFFTRHNMEAYFARLFATLAEAMTQGDAAAAAALRAFGDMGQRLARSLRG